MKKMLSNNIKISDQLFDLIKEIHNGNEAQAIDATEKFASIVRDFRDENTALLNKRVELQEQVDSFFINNKNAETSQVVTKLEEIGFISEREEKSGKGKGSEKSIPLEISPMAGPQLVVPADKANMVLNAANARWGSLYNALYTSNIIDPKIKDDETRRAFVVKYTADFLDKIVPFEDGVSWGDVKSLSLRGVEQSDDDAAIHTEQASKEWIASSHSLQSAPRSDVNLQAITIQGKAIFLNSESQKKLVGINFNEQGLLVNFLLENNGLKVEVKLNNEGVVRDVLLESTLTYIIDLEDASISAAGNKYESYRIIKGIKDGTLECEVRGSIRKMLPDTSYLDPITLEQKTLKRTALPLVRDVGPHMVADKEIIEIDGREVPEKILDCFITSLIGMRFHVAPKMHGAEEVVFNVRLWDAINKAQNLPKNANKIGIMNEELRTCAQLANCIAEARDIIFFTNTGFLDYTGSFIDLMMQAGAIAPYRILAAQTYKTEYEKHNVNISLAAAVPQIGAGMWAAIGDMAGLLKSKEAQVKGLTDTGWSPSPTASTIHAIAFHIFGNVREMQAQYATSLRGAKRSERDAAIHSERNSKEWIASSSSLRSASSNDVNIEDLFKFPRVDLKNLNPDEIITNLDFAIHGLLAYAEPWVRRGIGCSGVKDLSGEALMEDRATARIKAAFVRNWLLHNVITAEQVEDSINRMAKFVDGQNEGVPGYTSLRRVLRSHLAKGEGSERSEPDAAIHAKNTKEWIASSHSLQSAHRNDVDPVITAVRDVIFNPLNRKDSYVEPYFYPAYKRNSAFIG